MKNALIVTRGLFGILGLTQIVLGVLFWTGHALALTSMHMTLGYLFVITLWVLAALCARAGAPIGLVLAAVLWGALLPVLGVMQTRLMPGAGHWMVQAAHLLMGIIAMGLGGAMTARTHMAAGGVARPGPWAAHPQHRP